MLELSGIKEAFYKVTYQTDVEIFALSQVKVLMDAFALAEEAATEANARAILFKQVVVIKEGLSRKDAESIKKGADEIKCIKAKEEDGLLTQGRSVVWSMHFTVEPMK